MYYGLNFKSPTKDFIFLGNKTFWELLKLNNEGYNIYWTLNEFKDGSRKEKDITKFLTLGFDIDTFTTIFETEVKLHTLNPSLEISRFVKTHKGAHVYINLDEELQMMSTQDYKELHEVIRKTVNGDPLAKVTTLILKAPKFIDHKDDRGTLIREELDSTYTLNKELVEELLGHEVTLRTVKTKNTSIVESIDALDLIDKLNELHDDNSTYSQIQLVNWSDYYSILGTDGLKIKYDELDQRHKFYDFSKWNRFSIKGFLLNHVWNLDECVTDEDKQQVFKQVNYFLYKAFNVTLTKRNGLILSKDLLLKIKSNEFQVTTKQDEIDQALSTIENSSLKLNEELVNAILNNNKLNIKVLLNLINLYKQSSTVLDPEGYLEVDYKDFLCSLGLSSESDETRKKLDEMLLRMSVLRYSKKHDKIDRVELSFHQVLDVRFGIYKKTNKKYFRFKFYESINKSWTVTLSEQSLRLGKGLNDKYVRLALQVQGQVELYWEAYMTYDNICGLLELNGSDESNKDQIRKYTKELITNSVVSNYKFSDMNGVYLIK